jgi:hypothetical protein
MFDWLKDIVSDRSAKKPVARKPLANNTVKIDSRQYPLVSIGPKTLVGGEMDENLIAGQRLALTVSVDDACGKFSFDAKATIVSADANRRFTCEWGLLPPEFERVLIQYSRNKALAAQKPR